MKYTRIYTDDKGATHFGEGEVELTEMAYAPPAAPYFVSKPERASAIVMATLRAGWVGDWHPSPHLQYWFQLSGDLEVEVSDGEKRHLGPGSIVLVEDTTGRGHLTRVIGDSDVQAVYVQL